MKSPVYFIHGFLGVPAMWREVHRLLGAPQADALVLPGHGPEPWFPPEPGDFATSVDALAAMFPFKTPAVIVGYSMGARVALSFALRHPSLVRAAVLVGVDPGLEDEPSRAARVEWDEGWAKRAESGDLDAFVTAWESQPLFASQKALSAETQAELRRQRMSHTPHGVAWAMRTLGLGSMPSSWGGLDTTRVPMTVVSGALDPKFTAIARAFCARSVVSTLAVVDGVGHNVVVEAPAVLAKLIEERE